MKNEGSKPAFLVHVAVDEGVLEQGNDFVRSLDETSARNARLARQNGAASVEAIVGEDLDANLSLIHI